MADDSFADLVALVRQREADPAAPIACPVCGTPPLSIEDQSTRPIALWYAISCRHCGLDETIQIQLGTVHD